MDIVQDLHQTDTPMHFGNVMQEIKFLLKDLGIPLFYAKLVLGTLFSFLITFYSIPPILKISLQKNLIDEPGIRSSHLRKIPNLGGIAMFFFNFSLCIDFCI